MTFVRRLPIGAEVQPGGGVHFRVWAPRRHQVGVILDPGGARESAAPLTPEGSGYFSGPVPDAAAGTRYGFRLDGEPQTFPDPASRFQPDGPHGPSQVVDPAAFEWTDRDWPGRSIHGQVIYEMHVGAYTPEGTWAAAERELPWLVDLGITVIEVMPVAEFAGRFGWGYDGVDLFAPTRLYGQPDDFRRFVDRAHALGLAVILDVVYNHLGPDGNYLTQFSDAYLSKRGTEWGEAINFDGPDAAPVREFFVANAGYWIDEFHLDGLRLDATHAIFDDSPEHILAAVSRRVREAAAGRQTLVVAENEAQPARLARPVDRDGYGLDAFWNDDFHHSAVVALTGRREAYYLDYRGTPQELISAARHGYLYQGQRYAWQKQRRGTPAIDLPPAAFVTFVENHDQVANFSRGWRLHRLTSPGLLRAMTGLLLLLPGTPMLFMGQEFAASSPFQYFADHNPDLAKLVREGRHEFLAQFPSVARPEMRRLLPDPEDPETFARSKLDLSERERHPAAVALHRDLLRLRREDPIFAAQRAGALDGAVLAERAFVLRYFGEDGDDRLLVVNLGPDLRLEGAPEPLLAPPEGRRWRVIWSSEDPRYGGGGTIPPEDPEGGWRLSTWSTVALAPEAAQPA